MGTISEQSIIVVKVSSEDVELDMYLCCLLFHAIFRPSAVGGLASGSSALKVV